MALGELLNLIKSVSDIWDCRMEAVLEEMSAIPLCDLPEEEPLTVTEFLEHTQSRCQQSSQTLAKYVCYAYVTGLYVYDCRSMSVTASLCSYGVSSIMLVHADTIDMIVVAVVECIVTLHYFSRA